MGSCPPAKPPVAGLPECLPRRGSHSCSQCLFPPKHGSHSQTQALPANVSRPGHPPLLCSGSWMMTEPEGHSGQGDGQTPWQPTVGQLGSSRGRAHWKARENIQRHPKPCLSLWPNRTVLAFLLSTYYVPGPMFGAILFWFILSITSGDR